LRTPVKNIVLWAFIKIQSPYFILIRTVNLEKFIVIRGRTGVSCFTPQMGGLIKKGEYVDMHVEVKQNSMTNRA
jgi:hypothetical protein